MSETEKTPTELVDEAAQGPASATTDASSVSSHNLRDLIEYARFKASTEAAKSKMRGLNMARIHPPASA